MEEQDALRDAFQQRVRRILTQIRSVDLFAESGLHPREGLWSEALRRMVARILPSARDDTDLTKLVSRLYSTTEAIDHMVNRSEESFTRLARVLAPVDDHRAWAAQREDLEQAFRLLSVHIAGLGLSPGLRARTTPVTIVSSPFYQLPQSSRRLLEQHGDGSALEAWHDNVQRCRGELAQVHQCMEDNGVSTALVFDMRTMERAMTRMVNIADVLFVAEPHRSMEALKRLLNDVMNARRDDTSLRALVRENSSLIARKIVERTGKAGEHYIANSRREYRTIWRASLGGGLLTVLTAAVKMRITEAHFPPFLDGLAAGTNYAVSFIVMHHLHLALATKQPSVTAATLAGIVRTTQGKTRLERMAEFTSRISRTQLASAAGNVIAVIVGCVVFARLWAWIFSQPYLDVPSAAYVYDALNPMASGTVIYAILTGVLLWLSALAGGWFENFAVFNHLPHAIAQHPLGRKLGKERMEKLAAIVNANASNWTTCIVLGYLLGFVPAFGRFFGIPLDVRHVTLSTGTLALAAASFGREWLYRGWFIHTVFGIAIIFVLNLGVSFSIAAAVSLKAYGVSKRDQVRILRYVVLSALKSPRRFLLPPSDRKAKASGV